jgi:5,10-methylenetetrahydromethanopterin reductase
LKIGVTIPPIPEWLELIKLAEKLGYYQAWVNSDFTQFDSFSALTYAATQTSKIQLAPYSNSIFLRHPLLMASGIANIDTISNGRCCVNYCTAGLETIVGLGIPNEHALESMREAIEITRRLFNGEKLVYKGKYYTVNGPKLRLPARKDIPIYVSTRGQKYKLIGETADGAVTHGCTPKYVREARKQISVGANSRNRDPSKIEMTTITPLIVTENYDATLESIKPILGAIIGCEYDQTWLHTFDLSREEVKAIREAFTSDVMNKYRLPEFLSSSLTEKMVKGFAFIGSEDECINRITELENLGLTQVVVEIDFGVRETFDQMRDVITVISKKILPVFQT